MADSQRSTLNVAYDGQGRAYTDRNGCIWCGRPLEGRSIVRKLIENRAVRELAGHVLDCQVCIAAGRERNATRMCTAGQVLAARSCESESHVG